MIILFYITYLKHGLQRQLLSIIIYNTCFLYLLVAHGVRLANLSSKLLGSCRGGAGGGAGRGALAGSLQADARVCLKSLVRAENTHPILCCCVPAAVNR